MGSTSNEEIIITSNNNSYQVNNFIDLPLGIYFVQIRNENGELITSKRIIKN